jgi:hypothetical protein
MNLTRFVKSGGGSSAGRNRVEDRKLGIDLTITSLRASSPHPLFLLTQVCPVDQQQQHSGFVSGRDRRPASW